MKKSKVIAVVLAISGLLIAVDIVDSIMDDLGITNNRKDK